MVNFHSLKFKLQKRAIRIISGENYQAHSTPFSQTFSNLMIYFLETAFFVHRCHTNKLSNSQSLFFGKGYFDVNGILPLETILS